jgi:putative transposase
MEVMPDHVHILVGVDPQFGIAKLIRCNPHLRELKSRILA